MVPAVDQLLYSFENKMLSGPAHFSTLSQPLVVEMTTELTKLGGAQLANAFQISLASIGLSRSWPTRAQWEAFHQNYERSIERIGAAAVPVLYAIIRAGNEKKGLSTTAEQRIELAISALVSISNSASVISISNPPSEYTTPALKEVIKALNHNSYPISNPIGIIPNYAVRSAAEKALSRLRIPKGSPIIEDLVALLKAPVSMSFLAGVLGNTQDERVVEPLIEALHSADDRDQRDIVRALGQVGGPRVSAFLLDEFRNTDNYEVAAEATKILARLGWQPHESPIAPCGLF